jgi:hypothetical protein
MAVSAAERRFILNQLESLAANEIYALWIAADRLSDGDFGEYIRTGFPELVDTYHQAAAEVAAGWFEESIDLPNYIPVTAEPLSPDRINNSVAWALGGDGDKARDRLLGTMQRAVYDGARETTVINAESTGSRWIRVARPDACAFCRLLASRSVGANYEDYFYSSSGVKPKIDPETGQPYADGRLTTVVIGQRSRNRRDSSRKLGEDYHDFCHCTAREVPTGVKPIEFLGQEDPEAAVSAELWLTEYNKARESAESGDPKKILSEWRTLGDDIA